MRKLALLLLHLVLQKLPQLILLRPRCPMTTNILLAYRLIIPQVAFTLPFEILDLVVELLDNLLTEVRSLRELRFDLLVYLNVSL